MTAPQLAIVVDTEEEFDWDLPFARESRGTTSIPAQILAHDIYDRFGIVPTYVIDHPVATDPAAITFLSGLQREGRAEIGAHLHPWVTPPHDEEVSAWHSFHCNLPPALERAKIIAITDAITANFGGKPTIFKAGRFGFGPNTRAVLLELGYAIDCSFVPHVGFAHKGGPDYYGTPDGPHWLDDAKTLLEVPLTSGFTGGLRGMGAAFAPLFDSPFACKMRLPGVLSRTNLLSRVRLTPEGVSAEEQCQLLKALVSGGQRTFVLTYHSPSMAPGHTPYVRTAEELADFLQRIEQVLCYFRDDLGGAFTTLTRIRADMAAISANP